MHQLGVEVLALDLLLPLSRQKLDRIWIRKALLLLLATLEVVAVALDLVVDQHCGESVLQTCLELGVGLFAIEAQGIASDDYQVNVLHIRYEAQGIFLCDEVVPEV